MSLFRGWALVGCLISVSTSAVAEADLRSRYFQSVFSGDLSWMLSQQTESPSDQALVQRFQDRFLTRTPPSEFEAIDDPWVREVAGFYQAYWIDSLLEPDSLQDHEQALEQRLKLALREQGHQRDGRSVYEHLTDEVRERGFGFQGGRTQPLQDFILWRTTETEHYDVALTDGTQTVAVHFLDGFISQGWSHFATFGHAGTGGWAAEDGLYCIKSNYDLESERFKLSYLKHEARHYADYQRYPNLKGPDLEYRAKLTELVYAYTDQEALLTRFQAHANPQSTAPHPLANWHVLNNLSKHLGGTGFPQTPGHWDGVQAVAIRRAALELLELHDQRLEQAGQETAGLLAPEVSP